MKRLTLTIIMAVMTLTVMAQQSEHSLSIDQASFRPVQTDVLKGVAIDKIGVDRSKRPCARIKMHVNRMTREEIEQIEVRLPGGMVELTKRVVAAEGNGIIFEMTAKPGTRLYIHHDKFGDSNEVTISPEGNKEYRIDAQLNILLSMVVSSNIKGAEVYVDDQFKGVTGDDFMFTVQDVAPGAHKIAVVYGAARNEQTVDVSSNNISFRITVDSVVSLPQFVLFEVEPATAMVMIDDKPYTPKDGQVQMRLQNGKYVYRVMAQGYHSVQDTLLVSGAKIVRKVKLEPDVVQVTITASEGSEIWVNEQFKGKSPWTGMLNTGVYVFEARKQGYQPSYLSQDIKSEPAMQHFKLDAPTPVNAAFSVMTQPAMADVIIDGKKIGQTPLSADLLVGTHKMILRLDGYATITQDIEFVEGQPLNLSFDLTPVEDFFTPGKKHYDARQYAEAIAYFTKGAEQGDAKSECWLGFCYQKGFGVTMDAETAAHYFLISADKDFAEAQFQMANCYLHGRGVPKNATEAVKFYHKAAMQDHKRAQKSLASCYEAGIGTPRDMMRAMAWYQIASGQLALPKQ